MIGILTFQDTINFGAMLQTYALCKFINDQDIKSEVINYKCQKIEQVEHPVKVNEINTFRKLLYFIFTNKYKRKQLKHFRDFYNKYVISSKEKYNNNNIINAIDKYDRFIVGSDQIWNLDLSGGDYTFFLNFVNDKNKKYSYAASFGTGELVFNKIEKELLSDFSVLNVREKSGAEMIEKLIGRKANVVLDPTFLLNKEQWELLEPNKIVNKNYVFVYLIQRTKKIFNIIKKYAKDNNYEIIYLHNYLKPEVGVTNVRVASPIDFLSYIKYAKCIFTGSFHAICFSLIFHKEFFYTYASNNRNVRIQDLIELVQISFHELNNTNLKKYNKIEYSEVDKLLYSEIERSKKLLFEVLY